MSDPPHDEIGGLSRISVWTGSAERNVSRRAAELRATAKYLQTLSELFDDDESRADAALLAEHASRLAASAEGLASWASRFRTRLHSAAAILWRTKLGS